MLLRSQLDLLFRIGSDRLAEFIREEVCGFAQVIGEGMLCTFVFFVFLLDFTVFRLIIS